MATILEYPWSRENVTNPWNIFNKLRVWLFLPDYSDPPPSHRLIADLFQLFFVWLQLAVFQLENAVEPAGSQARPSRATAIIDAGGQNDEIVYEPDLYKNQPFYDFVSDVRNYLDKFKYGVYMYSYWLVLAMVYLTGTSRISLLCMGYVILSFFFLWYGQTFLCKPIQKLLKL